MKELQHASFYWKRYRFQNTINSEHIIEHAICVILMLVGVKTSSFDIFYDDVEPPPIEEDTAARAVDAGSSGESKTPKPLGIGQN